MRSSHDELVALLDRIPSETERARARAELERAEALIDMLFGASERIHIGGRRVRYAIRFWLRRMKRSRAAA